MEDKMLPPVSCNLSPDSQKFITTLQQKTDLFYQNAKDEHRSVLETVVQNIKTDTDRSIDSFRKQMKRNNESLTKKIKDHIADSTQALRESLKDELQNEINEVSTMLNREEPETQPQSCTADKTEQNDETVVNDLKKFLDRIYQTCLEETVTTINEANVSVLGSHNSLSVEVHKVSHIKRQARELRKLLGQQNNNVRNQLRALADDQKRLLSFQKELNDKNDTLADLFQQRIDLENQLIRQNARRVQKECKAVQQKSESLIAKLNSVSGEFNEKMSNLSNDTHDVISLEEDVSFNTIVGEDLDDSQPEMFAPVPAFGLEVLDATTKEKDARISLVQNEIDLMTKLANESNPPSEKEKGELEEELRVCRQRFVHLFFQKNIEFFSKSREILSLAGMQVSILPFRQEELTDETGKKHLSKCDVGLDRSAMKGVKEPEEK